MTISSRCVDWIWKAAMLHSCRFHCGHDTDPGWNHWPMKFQRYGDVLSNRHSTYLLLLFQYSRGTHRQHWKLLKTSLQAGWELIRCHGAPFLASCCLGTNILVSALDCAFAFAHDCHSLIVATWAQLFDDNLVRKQGHWVDLHKQEKKQHTRRTR